MSSSPEHFLTYASGVSRLVLDMQDCFFHLHPLRRLPLACPVIEGDAWFWRRPDHGSSAWRAEVLSHSALGCQLAVQISCALACDRTRPLRCQCDKKKTTNWMRPTSCRWPRAVTFTIIPSNELTYIAREGGASWRSCQDEACRTRTTERYSTVWMLKVGQLHAPTTRTWTKT